MTNTKTKSKNNNKIVKVKGLPCTQNGKTFYAASLPIAMSKIFKFDIYNHKTGVGYNRDDVLEKRAKEFKEFILDHDNFCSDAIHLNDTNGCITIKPNQDKEYVDIIIDTSKGITDFEGQGRGRAYQMICEENEEYLFNNLIQIPVIISRISKEKEISQCHTMNTKRKKMKAQIKYMHSFKVVLNKINKGTKLSNIPEKEKTSALSFYTINRMNNARGSCFKDRFIMPNRNRQSVNKRREKLEYEEKGINDETITIGSHAHHNNLGVVALTYMKLNNNFNSFNRLANSFSKAVMDFWQAIYEINPEVFEITRTIYTKMANGKSKVAYQGYHIQSNKGCFLLYGILDALLKKGVKTKAGFKKELSRSEKKIKNTKYWEENKNKKTGIQIASTSTYKIHQMELLKEIGIL